MSDDQTAGYGQEEGYDYYFNNSIHKNNKDGKIYLI